MTVFPRGKRTRQGEAVPEIPALVGADGGFAVLLRVLCECVQQQLPGKAKDQRKQFISFCIILTQNLISYKGMI